MSKAAKRERQRQNRLARREYEAALEKRRRFWRSVRGFVIILVPIAALFLFFALRDSDGTSKTPANDRATAARREKAARLPAPTGLTIDPTKSYTATLETTEGTIEIALDAQHAPNSVNNFVYLARNRFFDGLRFNRAARDFVIQTGSPTNTTVGGPGYTIPAELPAAGYEIGSVAWAKAPSEPAGTAGSQFFIGTGANVTTLSRDYGYIGHVTRGLDVAQRIMGYAPPSGDGKPTKAVTITKVTIAET